MLSFNWEEFKSSCVAVHCTTDAEARDFLSKCEGRGINWIDETPSTVTNWDIYGKLTCFEYYTRYTGGIEGHNIVQWSLDSSRAWGSDYKIIKWEV